MAIVTFAYSDTLARDKRCHSRRAHLYLHRSDERQGKVSFPQKNETNFFAREKEEIVPQLGLRDCARGIRAEFRDSPAANSEWAKPK